MATGLGDIMMDSSPLSQACIKALTDRMEEKRKLAASEIEKMTVEFSMSQNMTMINRLVAVLGRKFCLSPAPNIRKGGLLGLAAVLVGFKNAAGGAELHQDTVEEVLRPILTCFLDSDAQVRYYACESLFNVAKVAKERVLRFFDQIFDNLAKVVADPDPHVRSATDQVNRLLKDLVMEQPSFQVEPFAARLEEYIYTKNPHTRMFIVAWIRVLDSKCDMTKFLPLLLDGIFNCLYDSTEPIKATTLSLLAHFLAKVSLKQSHEVNVTALVGILLKHAKNTNEDLVQCTAIAWLKQMIALMDDEDKLSFTPRILSAILPCLAAEPASVVDDALSIVADIVHSTPDDQQQQQQVIPTSQQEERESAKTPPSNLNKSKRVAIDSPPPPLPPTDEPQNPNIYLIVKWLARMFDQDDSVFQERATFIILNLCSILKPELVYKTFASIIINEKLDTKLRLSLVQKLNHILLTSQPLFELRRRLYSPAEHEDSEMVSLFNNLYLAWCYSSIDTLTLCLLTKNYRLANEIVVSMSMSGHLDADTIEQLGLAVEMLESELAFVPLRMHLLDVRTNRFLLQTLYGLLMILPQAEAYTKLANRLDQVCKFMSAQVHLKTTMPGDFSNQPGPMSTGALAQQAPAVNAAASSASSGGSSKSQPRATASGPGGATGREPLKKPAASSSIEALMKHFTSIQERLASSRDRTQESRAS